MVKVALGALMVMITVSAGLAEEMKVTTADSIKWGPAPPSLPKGAQLAVLSGDPASDGPFVVRVKLPAGYQVAAHNHPTTENVTVLSGTFNIGMGDKLDTQKGQLLHTGGFAEAAAKMNHYAWTSGETVVQVHGQGPFAITYVNPADDPSKNASKASD